MIQETPAITAQRDFSQLLNKVQYQHEQFIITDAGKPIAALVDMLQFEKIRQNERIFQTMMDEIALVFADSSEDEIDALLNEAKRTSGGETGFDGGGLWQCVSLRNFALTTGSP